MSTGLHSARPRRTSPKPPGADCVGLPRARLQAFLDSVIESKESITRHGCPVGSLSQELNKSPARSRARANEGLILRAQWVSEQFRAMGRWDAQDLGVWMIASVQGVILMANAILKQQCGALLRRLPCRWVP